MQLWSFRGRTLKTLIEYLQKYHNRAISGAAPLTDPGIHTINQLQAPIAPIFSDCPDCWINLNTEQDFKRARKSRWLKK
jgi:hypothetical protein